MVNGLEEERKNRGERETKGAGKRTSGLMFEEPFVARKRGCAV
jgi:hypothetical protein